MNAGQDEKYIVYIDTGGTFSDAIVIGRDGTFVTGKSPTTSDNLAECFFGSIESAAEKMGITLKELVSKAMLLGFGTTAGTNAVIARIVPKIGMITTKGFEDTSTIMRLGRWVGLPRLEGLHIAGSDKPEPLVPRTLTKGVTERIDSLGKVFIPLYEEETRKIVKELVEEKVEGIAVCLLWSFLNDTHEKRIKEIIAEIAPDMPVSISSEIMPIIREYARFNTTVIDLCIGKPVRRLFSEVRGTLKKLGYEKELLVLQGGGGLSRSEVVDPVFTLNSGPVGGLIGVEFWKEIYGFENAISSDVGGTSFDVSLIPKEGPTYIREPLVGRYMVANPMLEITCVGAGGGTMAYVDPAVNRLRVGPESAGAVPGPVCYDQGGTEPTVTDADVVMNRINPDYFLGGKMRLNKDKAIKAIEEKIAGPLGMTVEEAALSICEVIDESMGGLLRVKLNEKGLNSRDFALFAFGGAGATHCGGYVRGLKFKKVIIPPYAATFSAFGASTANIMHRYMASPYIVMPKLPYDITTQQFELTSLDEFPSEAIERFNRMYQGLEDRAYKEMKEEGFKPEEVRVHYEIQMRYGGQLYEVVCPCPVNRINSVQDVMSLIRSYENEYVKMYGKGVMYAQGGIEIITLILEAWAPPAAKPVIPKRDRVGEDATPALKGEREVYFSEGYFNTPIYAIQKLQPGNLALGPAIIEGDDITLVVSPDNRVTVDEYLNMILEES